MMTRYVGPCALTLAAAFGFTLAAFAETSTWVGDENAAWMTESNWDPAAVPTASSQVRLNHGAVVSYDGVPGAFTNFVEKVLLVGTNASAKIVNADTDNRNLHILGQVADDDGFYRFVGGDDQKLTFSGAGLKVDVATVTNFMNRGILVKGTVAAEDGANLNIHGVDVGDNAPKFVAKNGGEIGFGGDVKIYDNAVLTIESDGSGSSVGTFGSLLNQNGGLYTVNLLATNSAYIGVPIFSFSSKSILRLVSVDDSTIQVGQISSLPKNSSILLANGDMFLNGDLTLGGSNPITLTVDGCGTIENDNDAPGTTITLKSNATVRFKPDEKALDKEGVFNTCVDGSGVLTIDAASKLDIDMSVLGAQQGINSWEIPYAKCKASSKANLPVITITEGYDCKFRLEADQADANVTRVTLVINRSEVRTWNVDFGGWGEDSSWLEGTMPYPDDTVIIDQNAEIDMPENNETAAGMTIADGVNVKFSGITGKSLVMEDDALKSAIGENATVEVTGKENTFKFHNSQGTIVGDNVTLKATDGGYLKVSHAVLNSDATVTLIADGSSAGVDSQMKFEATNENVTVNMTASNNGFLNLQGYAASGLVNLEVTEGGRVDAKSISPAAGSSVVLSNGTLRIMNNGNLSLGASKKPMALTLAGDDTAVFATNNYTEVTFGPELTVKLAPTEAWVEKTLVTVQSSSDPKTSASCKFTLAEGAKFEIDLTEFGEIGEGKTFRLVSVAGTKSTLSANIPAAENVTLVGGTGLEATFAITEDGKALDVTIAPASGETVEAQVAAAKAGDTVMAPEAVVAADGKSFTYAGGAAPVTKDHYVFEAVEGGVMIDIDQAEAEVAAIAIDGTTVKVTLKNEGVSGFFYALESSATVDFLASEKSDFAAAEGSVELTATAEGPIQFYRAVVTDVEKAAQE